MTDCTCPLVGDEVRYQGVVLSTCGVFVRWSCQHQHDSRDAAERCADKELDKSTEKR